VVVVVVEWVLQAEGEDDWVQSTSLPLTWQLDGRLTVELVGFVHHPLSVEEGDMQTAVQNCQSFAAAVVVADTAVAAVAVVAVVDIAEALVSAEIEGLCSAENDVLDLETPRVDEY